MRSLPANPIYVFAPIATAKPLDASGTFPVPPHREQYSEEAIGLLDGFHVYHDQAAAQLQQANEVLAPFGVKVETIVRSLFHPEGDVQSMTCYGVFAASMEDAEKLPGFVPIFLLSPRERLCDLIKDGPNKISSVN